jgi:hypothetical protein
MYFQQDFPLVGKHPSKEVPQKDKPSHIENEMLEQSPDRTMFHCKLDMCRAIVMQLQRQQEARSDT